MFLLLFYIDFGSRIHSTYDAFYNTSQLCSNPFKSVQTIIICLTFQAFNDLFDEDDADDEIAVKPKKPETILEDIDLTLKDDEKKGGITA